MTEHGKITLITTPNHDGRIVEEISTLGQIMRQVIDTRELHTRKALIKLGWTPPDNAKTIEPHSGVR